MRQSGVRRPRSQPFIIYVVREGESIWIDGVKKRSPDQAIVAKMGDRTSAYFQRTPNGWLRCDGFVSLKDEAKG